VPERGTRVDRAVLSQLQRLKVPVSVHTSPEETTLH
jgi:hypothetical protein